MYKYAWPIYFYLFGIYEMGSCFIKQYKQDYSSDTSQYFMMLLYFIIATFILSTKNDK